MALSIRQASQNKNNYTKQEMILHIPDLQKEDYSDHLN